MTTRVPEWLRGHIYCDKLRSATRSNLKSGSMKTKSKGKSKAEINSPSSRQTVEALKNHFEKCRQAMRPDGTTNKRLAEEAMV